MKFHLVVSMNHEHKFQGSSEHGQELPKGWGLKTREKGRQLPEPVIY